MLDNPCTKTRACAWREWLEEYSPAFSQVNANVCSWRCCETESYTFFVFMDLFLRVSTWLMCHLRKFNELDETNRYPWGVAWVIQVESNCIIQKVGELPVQESPQILLPILQHPSPPSWHPSWSCSLYSPAPRWRLSENHEARPWPKVLWLLPQFGRTH